MFCRSVTDKLDPVFDDLYTPGSRYDLMLRLAYYYQADYVPEPLCKWRMSDVDEKSWKKPLVPRIVEINAVVENLVTRHSESAVPVQTGGADVTS